MDVNFTVTEERRKLWAVQLDILEKFKEICKKYNLTYYAGGGTLLGAARHKGYIPWDDDLDIFMKWEEFKILLEVAPQECTYPYFFMSYNTEKFSDVVSTRIRRSDTTCCTRWEHNNICDPNYNKGIFIDIFPLFYLPETQEERNLQKELIMDAWKAMRGFLAEECEKRNFHTYNQEYKKYIDVYHTYREKYTIQQIKRLYLDRCGLVETPTKELGLISVRTFDKNFMWDTSWFAQTIELPFEDTTVVCPYKYDEVLTNQYGDWRTPINCNSMHEILIVDTDVSYKEKLKLENS